MMQTLVKTTVLLPAHLLQKAKLRAVHEKTTVAAMIRESLADRLAPSSINAHTVVSDPLRHLGVFTCGIQTPYAKRSDLYEEHV
ncbi:hypothetical protein HY947_06350 [Candidatus Gottesmanbacteria bacterium]|nr:hypothetical protein [Candidatus Gottesmanbacteria bacterium]